MKLGIVGKPNVGKSTFFTCITDNDAEIGDYPFTTIEPNLGVGYVVVDCPCAALDVSCDANTRCVDGHRFVPINVLDIAGLVPGAAEGKGMGNEFLDAVREANALIQVIDVSGKTDAKGEPTEDYDPAEDVAFVEEEFDAWLFNLVRDRWDNLVKKMRSEDANPAAFIADKLSGLGVQKHHVSRVLTDDVNQLIHWSDEDLRGFVRALRKESKPLIYACNKIDVDRAAEKFAALQDQFPDKLFVPMSAHAEHALQSAAEQGVVDYVPGEDTFTVTGDLSTAQAEGLQEIRTIMQEHGGTGVQTVMRRAVFDLLDMIVVYPVQDASHYTDKEGNVLPDAILLKQGSTAVDLAYAIHTDIGDRYAKAVDAQTGRAIGKDQELEHGQIVKVETQ